MRALRSQRFERTGVRPFHSGTRPTLVALLLLAGLAGGVAEADFTPGSNARSLSHDGELRTYNVYAPPFYGDLTTVPLVVDLHGFGSSGAQQKIASGWDGEADYSGLLIVYPDGIGGSWNAGVCCGDAQANGVDDVGFIRAMVVSIAAEAPSVDLNRVYVTGLSNGGAMTHRLACEAADLFAAAAPLAFPTPYVDFANECQPLRPIPLLLSMGLTDVLVLYEDGAFGGAIESLESWRAKNACGSEPMEVHLQFGGSYCDLDTSCGEGVQTGLCSIRGSAFGPPLEGVSGHILYNNLDGMAVANELWRFLEQFRRHPIGGPIPVAGPTFLIVLAGALIAAAAARLRIRRRWGLPQVQVEGPSFEKASDKLKK